VDLQSFDEISDDFDRRVRDIVWCTVATVDAKGRPRSRVLHPIWEGATGWIMTGRHSFKDKHLARDPHVSLSYWDPQKGLLYADCEARWEDAPAEKRRLWTLFASTPPPYGYDPSMFWPSPESEQFGLLRLTPWRIELHSLAELAAGTPSRVWRAR